MEFGERKRRRKSQSFRVVTDEDLEPPLANSSCTDSSRVWEAARVHNVQVLEEDEQEGTEIKRQITGMMRLLSDKPGRVFQRSGPKDLQDYGLNWAQPPATLPHPPETPTCTHAAEPEPSSSCPIPMLANGLRHHQDTTSSSTTTTTTTTTTPPRNPQHPSHHAKDQDAPPSPCCMHPCQATLQAILQELRSMRRLMLTQQASLAKQEPTASPWQPGPDPGPSSPGSGPAPHQRARKRRPIFKMAPLHASGRRASVCALGSCAPPVPHQSGDVDGPNKGRAIHAEGIKLAVQNVAIAAGNQHSPVLAAARGPPPKESAVRLAEEYDVFIPKAQLDSILVNYTRSGSLLFRKLVCAFFDDSTLANSLPNGKRKRGLNDHRQGLDQHIVGAIKGFTEKYCTTHRIEKLPGPRDWVQILQDQIKLARRRLKRDAEDVSSKASSSRDSI